MTNYECGRRQFLRATGATSLGVAAGFGSWLGASFAAAQPGLQESTELAEQRAAARGRRRRLIYNDDGCGPLGYPEAHTPEGFLSGPHSRMAALKGSQVDSVFFCSGSTHVFNHPTEVAESYADVSERYGIGAEWETYRANIRAMEKLGTDPLSLTLGFCREQGLEFFYSHRINDIHNTFLDIERSTWFREHPEYWLGTPEAAAKAGGINSPRHWWSALDFEQPGVHDHLCKIQEEVCGRFDIDGMDIDYFRGPLLFRSNLDFKPASDRQLDVLTDFQRRLRSIHLAASAKRNRPLLTAARVPATVEKCRFIGIDIERWLKEGLLDIVALSGGYVPFTEPVGEIVKLAHAVSVPVYATISNSGMRGPDSRYGSLEAWRGVASNLWHAGVDGIEVFNLFPPPGTEPRLQELGSQETLAGKDKIFFIDAERVLEGDLVMGIEQSQTLPVAVPADGKEALAVLPVGDDLPAAATGGKLESTELQIQFSNPAVLEDLALKLNGKALTPVRKDEQTGSVVYDPSHDQFRVGRNELKVRVNKAASDGTDLTIKQVMLTVVYKK